MNQVAVTGVGVVSPIGTGVGAFWDAVLAGRHAFRSIADADARGLGGNRL